LEHIAGPSSLDEDRSAYRIDSSEIHAAHVLDGRGGGELPAGGVEHVELQNLARSNARRGLEAVVPAEVRLVDGAGLAHRLIVSRPKGNGISYDPSRRRRIHVVGRIRLPARIASRI